LSINKPLYLVNNVLADCRTEQPSKIGAPWRQKASEYICQRPQKYLISTP